MCACACVHVCACVRAYVCACVCACVRACVRACVCVCVCVCVCTCTDSWRLCGVIHNVPMFRKLSLRVPGHCMGLVCMFTVTGKVVPL